MDEPFSIILVTLFTNSPESSRALTIFVTSCISSFDITRVVVPNPEAPDPRIFLWIPASAADATTVNLNGINTVLANG